MHFASVLVQWPVTCILQVTKTLTWRNLTLIDAVLTHPHPTAPTRAGYVVTALIAAWFGAVLAASLTGTFEVPAGELPLPILTALAIPLALFATGYRFLPSFRDFVLHLDLRPLILLHAFRTVGAGFLLLAAFDVLPLAFSIPAGVGDLIAAAGALVVGVALYTPRGLSRRWLTRWNSFGIADFIVAVATGTLSGTGGLLHFNGSVSSDAMGSFPLVLIPAFFVPLFLITHLIVLIHLRTQWRGVSRISFSQ